MKRGRTPSAGEKHKKRGSEIRLPVTEGIGLRTQGDLKGTAWDARRGVAQ